VEFLCDHALILPVIIAEGVAPLRQYQRINCTAIVEIEAHLGHQFRKYVVHTTDAQAPPATAERTIAALNQRPPSELAHRQMLKPRLAAGPAYRSAGHRTPRCRKNSK